jgi:hypothetical protein
LRNRRYLGLGMAVSHGAHLGGIVALAARDGHAFWATVASSSVIGGSLGYALIAAMVVTSTDDARRRLGARAWRALHTTGMWALWLIFVGSYAGRLAHDHHAAARRSPPSPSPRCSAASRLRTSLHGSGRWSLSSLPVTVGSGSCSAPPSSAAARPARLAPPVERGEDPRAGISRFGWGPHVLWGRAFAKGPPRSQRA